MVVQLVRLIWRVIWFALTHPGVDAVAALVVVTWLGLGWPGLVGLAAIAVVGLAGLRVLQPSWFARFVAGPVRDWLRWWFYRRRWKAAMTLAGLAPDYRGQPMLPVLGRVHRAGAVDLVRVGLVTGQAPADFEARAENLAHAFGARLCRIRSAAPGVVMLELVRADTLADPIGALPITGRGGPGRAAGRPVRGRLALAAAAGRDACADRRGYRVGEGLGDLVADPRAAARHRLGVGAGVGAGPKRMELSFGRALFHRYACQAAAMVELLEAAVAEMHDRAGQFGGRTRTFTPSTGFPFVVVLVDELAFLTAYQPERDLRKRAEAAIATLTSQGRSVGVCVVGALQDPRKDVISLRNLFSTRIALRLDESDQVDMVLGDGARDRGALADQISPLPYVGAGVGYVRLEASPDPVRVRAAYVVRRGHHGDGRGGRLPARRWPMRETAWRTDEPCPVCQHRAGPGRHRRAGPAGRMPPVRLRRAVRHRGHRLGRCLVTAGRTTRAERMAMPLARQVVKDLAAEHGACLRPVQLRRTEIDTGHVEQVLIPCGHTLASVCPSCAERARILRAAQCREGWHLDHEPVIDPDPATEDQRATVTDRAEAQADRDALAGEGLDTSELDERIGELDQQITDAGLRGQVLPARPRRHRSTRRRQDAAPLPRRTVNPRTVGKTYTTPDGKTFRPSLFVTLTCPSYGRVGEDGAPADPDTYDYTRAARDALHFAALFDRFIQNLRRFTGYDLQYFAAIEPQRRLAPHVHLAIRGTISRAELREVIAATYHQVWWPSTQTVKYDGGHLPVVG